MDREMSILSSSTDKLKILEEVMAEHGRRPSKWLEAYYQKLNL
jgi:type IV secretory pathway VirB4 component